MVQHLSSGLSAVPKTRNTKRGTVALSVQAQSGCESVVFFRRTALSCMYGKAHVSRTGQSVLTSTQPRDRLSPPLYRKAHICAGLIYDLLVHPRCGRASGEFSEWREPHRATRSRGFQLLGPRMPGSPGQSQQGAHGVQRESVRLREHSTLLSRRARCPTPPPGPTLQAIPGQEIPQVQEQQ